MSRSTASYRSAGDAGNKNLTDAKASADRLVCSFLSLVLNSRTDAAEVQEASLAQSPCASCDADSPWVMLVYAPLTPSCCRLWRH